MRGPFRFARAGLFNTPFEAFERNVRSTAASILSGTGFEPTRGILEVTVSRWGHGCCLGRNIQFDDETGPRPAVTGRQKFGHTAIACSDASGIDNAQTAMDEDARAVRELEPGMYGVYEDR